MEHAYRGSRREVYVYACAGRPRGQVPFVSVLPRRKSVSVSFTRWLSTNSVRKRRSPLAVATLGSLRRLSTLLARANALRAATLPSPRPPHRFPPPHFLRCPRPMNRSRRPSRRRGSSRRNRRRGYCRDCVRLQNLPRAQVRPARPAAPKSQRMVRQTPQPAGLQVSSECIGGKPPYGCRCDIPRT